MPREETIQIKIDKSAAVKSISELKKEGRTSFKTDMVITNINRVEANPDRFIDADYVTVRGVVFNFRNAV